MTKELKHIIQGCLELDRVSQKALFELYNKGLLSLAYRLTQDKELAKESTQECWIEVFKSINRYDKNKGELRPWLNTILIRKTWKVIRKQPDNSSLNLNITTPSHSNNIIEKFTCEEILQEIKHIPPGSRMVFKLFVLEEYTHEEIGKLLNISESASRSHLTKARKIMKERYRIINKTTYNEL